MTYHYDDFNYVLRLERGEHLIEALNDFALKIEKKTFWLCGLGAAEWAELGFYDLPTQNYHWRRFDQPMEITSLQGNLAWQDDQPVWHIHATLSDADFRAAGGHVKELEIGGTCEILLHTIDSAPLTRSKDPEVGLSLLDL